MESKKPDVTASGFLFINSVLLGSNSFSGEHLSFQYHLS